MFGRVIVALLIIGAAAMVTMERETAEVADMTAILAESKYAAVQERAVAFEQRAKAAEARIGELDAKIDWLERELAETTRLKELALLPLELRLKDPSVRGGLALHQVMQVVRANKATTTPCFARAPERGPELTMKWVIDQQGDVVSVSNGSVPDGFDDVAACLAEEVSLWTFPPPKDGLTLAQVTWTTAAVGH